jgi:hypothetical protein
MVPHSVQSMSKLVLESCEAVFQLDGLCKIRVDENLEGTVNRRSADSRVFPMDDAIEVVYRHVAAGLEEVLQDDLPLS